MSLLYQCISAHSLFKNTNLSMMLQPRSTINPTIQSPKPLNSSDKIQQPEFQRLEMPHQVPFEAEYSDYFGVLSKLTQRKSLLEYQLEFDFLAHKSPWVSQHILLNCFVSGLRSDLRKEVQVYRPTDLVQAKKLARLLDDKQSDTKWNSCSCAEVYEPEKAEWNSCNLNLVKNDLPSKDMELMRQQMNDINVMMTDYFKAYAEPMVDSSSMTSKHAITEEDVTERVGSSIARGNEVECVTMNTLEDEISETEIQGHLADNYAAIPYANCQRLKAFSELEDIVPAASVASTLKFANEFLNWEDKRYKLAAGLHSTMIGNLTKAHELVLLMTCLYSGHISMVTLGNTYYGGPLKYWLCGTGCRWKIFLAKSYHPGTLI